MSTPLEMAKAECANYCKDGSCLGIPVECLVSERDDKKVKLVAAPLERCDLVCKKKMLDLGPEPVECSSFAELDRFLDEAENKARRSGGFYFCRYFEKAVIGLVQYRPRYAKAVERYKKRPVQAPPPPAAIAGMWECDCGNPMPKGRRMCDACRGARQRERWKKAKRRKRD